MTHKVNAQEEIGYPHEIITFSVKRANDVLKGNYLKRTKVMALLVLNIVENSTRKYRIQINKKEDINLRVLYAICKNSKFTTNLFNEHQTKLNDLFQQYKERKSSPAFDSLKEFIQESLFLHIISTEWKGKKLIKTDFVKEASSIFSSDNQLNGLLQGFQALDKEDISDKDVNEIVTKIHGIINPILLEIAIYLTFNLAMKFTEHKNRFLFEHYLILRNVVQNFSGIIGHERLDDTVLESLFITSVILYFCGYKKAIRLPHEEKLNYFEHLISISTIVPEFRRIYEKYAIFNLKYIRVPLWLVGLINSIFILLSMLNEIYLSAGLNLPIISVNLPFNIPLFATISLLLLIFISLHLYRLKGQMIRELRRG
jgi:hypothetical protein